MTAIRRSALVSYSAHEMFALVADIPSYPQFLPWCGGARIVSANEDEMIAAIDIAYSGVHKTFTTRNLHQKDKMIDIRLLDGPFSYLQGFWRFDALENDAQGRGGAGGGGGRGGACLPHLARSRVRGREPARRRGAHAGVFGDREPARGQLPPARGAALRQAPVR